MNPYFLKFKKDNYFPDRNREIAKQSLLRPELEEDSHGRINLVLHSPEKVLKLSISKIAQKRTLRFNIYKKFIKPFSIHLNSIIILTFVRTFKMKEKFGFTFEVPLALHHIFNSQILQGRERLLQKLYKPTFYILSDN